MSAAPAIRFTPAQYRLFLADFIECDRNKDGFLQHAEIAEMLSHQLNRPPTDQEVSAVMRRLDTSRTGQVSFSDYLSALCGGGGYRVLPSDVDLSTQQIVNAVSAQMRVLKPLSTSCCDSFLWPNQVIVNMLILFRTPALLLDAMGDFVWARAAPDSAALYENRRCAQCEYCFQVMGIFLDDHELECLYSLGGGLDLIDFGKVLGTLHRISGLQPADAAGVPSQQGVLRNSHRMLGHHLRTKLLRDTFRSHVAQYCESKNKSLGVLTTYTNSYCASFALQKHMSAADMGSLERAVCAAERVFEKCLKNESSKSSRVATPGITAAGLLQLAATVRLRVSWLELEQLIFRADTNADGRVDWNEFLNFATFRVSDGKARDCLCRTTKVCDDGGCTEVNMASMSQSMRMQNSKSQGNLRPTASVREDDSEHEIVNQFLFGIAGNGNYGNMAQSFREIDTDRNQRLSMVEVYTRMQAMGLSVSRNTAIEIFSRFDLDHNGEIEYNEFFDVLRMWQANRSTPSDDQTKLAAANIKYTPPKSAAAAV